MRILAIGDVTGEGGVRLLEEKLWSFRRENKIDFCIANAENAGFITGASAEIAERLLMAGADCLSGGNHTLMNKAAYTYLDDTDAMLRPLNYPDGAPGHGYAVLDCMGYKLLVISVMGTVNITPVLDSPYDAVDRALRREEGRYDLAVMDVHAEATGEKLALAFNYDGIISAVFGTHTHVPTADMKILPKGTGYVTDLGMCGESGGVLGMSPESVIKRMRTKLADRFVAASGAAEADGVIFDIDEKSKRTRSLKRVVIR